MPRKVNVRPKKYVCEGFSCQTGRYTKYVKHVYSLVCDSDGNYRSCMRCGKVSFRLAAGEGDRVRA